ncbi:competence/damage-inducible protein A [Thermogemmatispora carboxidivorans]|uniref:competence/damage-inducible protein A n=1 Tax=Thermogemmatispora carboxidivorans TaxID=1382306 RepID=UPI00069CAC58|nr:competence/damage-inducible protein A [Thermogemmatispora carboxidivorans]
MRAEIISCGTELLLGQITDTNATYLAQSLSGLGIDLYFVSQVGDNLERIVETLRRAWERSELIIMTGGLGPTEDDLTREAISTLLGEHMQVDPSLEAELRAWFAARGVQMPERNVKQATLIPSARPLPNPLGTAPGWWVEKAGRIIVAMPGVPREMYRMWEAEAIPRLSPYTGGLIFTRILRVIGLGESTVEQRLEPFIHASNPTVATYAKSDAVDVRVTAKAASHKEAERLVSETEARIREVLGNYIFGVDKETLPSVVGTMLAQRGQTLAVMESFTGGLLSSLITDIPGSSRYFRGGLVAYSRAVAQEMGLSPEPVERAGLVSEETARAMAQLARQRLAADYGLGITGVAGPEPFEQQPAGTLFLAIAGPTGVVTSSGSGWRGNREDQKYRSALAALNLLRLHLLGLKKAQ